MERFTERGFQRPRNLFSLWALWRAKTLVQPQFSTLTQPSNHTYVMLIKVPRMNDTRARQNLREIWGRIAVYPFAVEAIFNPGLLKPLRHDSGSRMWPPHRQSKQIRGQSGHGLIRHDCARLVSRYLLCLRCLCV